MSNRFLTVFIYYNDDKITNVLSVLIFPLYWSMIGI